MEIVCTSVIQILIHPVGQKKSPSDGESVLLLWSGTAMLQQILRDMFIDPDVLAELSEEQKQVLFLKMRQLRFMHSGYIKRHVKLCEVLHLEECCMIFTKEQLRRWNEYDKKWEATNQKEKKTHNTVKKNVNFLLGIDGKEWVWVMGDHKTDKTVEQILEEEAQAKSLKLAEKEAEELRKKQEEEMKKKIAEEQKKIEEERKRREDEMRKQEADALYQSIKEARLAAEREAEKRKKEDEEEQLRVEELRRKWAEEKRISIEKADNLKKRRSGELYVKWKEMRRELEKVALDSSKEVEKNWVEQEKKAKVAEEQMREIARRAREEHQHSIRNSINMVNAANAFSVTVKDKEKPPVPPKNRDLVVKRKSRPLKPPNKQAVIEWFHEEEKQKATVIDNTTGKIGDWFHGVIGRFEAEKLLLEKPLGTYLVRVSEKLWGYTISYRAKDRCKHFLIDASDGRYRFFNTDQMEHNSITDLVDFHKVNPITVIGGEKLLYPQGQTIDPPDYWELYQNLKSEVTSL